MSKLNFRKIVSDYEQPVNTYVNITELKTIPVDMDVEEQTFQDKDGQDYNALMAVVDDVSFRVPKSVIAQVQTLLEFNPKMESFRVTKSGSGLQTKYMVMEA